MPGAPRSLTRIPESVNALRQRLCFRVHFGEQPNYVHPRVRVAGNTAPVKQHSRIAELVTSNRTVPANGRLPLLLRQSTCNKYPGIGDEPLKLRIVIRANGT